MTLSNFMRGRGSYLIDERGRTFLGPSNNVIKIKPPLVVTQGDVDRFVLELDVVLALAKASSG